MTKLTNNGKEKNSVFKKIKQVRVAFTSSNIRARKMSNVNEAYARSLRLPSLDVAVNISSTV